MTFGVPSTLHDSVILYFRSLKSQEVLSLLWFGFVVCVFLVLGLVFFLCFVWVLVWFVWVGVWVLFGFLFVCVFCVVGFFFFSSFFPNSLST